MYSQLENVINDVTNENHRSDKECGCSFQNIRIDGHIHKRLLEMDAGIEEVSEGAPFLKNASLVLLLGQLVVDILKLDCLGVVPICDTAP